jgi:branched-chain amino acid transport system ATP-binding protein
LAFIYTISGKRRVINMEALRIQHLQKNFGGVQALRDVSLTVKSGERLGIIGPNGAGKTTLLNVLTGDVSPASGRVYFFGHDVTTAPIYRRAHLGIGRSFQIINVFLNLSVIHNLLLALQGTMRCRHQMLRSIASYRNLFAEAEELLKYFALWETRALPAKALSYGEKRKLEIALSLASKPKLLLLDEPSCGLTVAESLDLTDIIRNLGSDITVLFVAHDIDLVFNLADRIIVLHYGEVIAEGTPEEIGANAMVREIYMGLNEGT